MLNLVRCSTLLLTILLIESSLLAQSWELVRDLRPGTRVKVQETNGTEHKGSIVTVSLEAISVQTGRTNVSVTRANVKRVQLHSSARRARNIALWAGIGVAIGVTLDKTLGVRLRNEGTDSGQALMYLVPIGLFGGLGAAISPYRTIYHVQ